MADVLSRNQRGYVQVESTYGTIPNSSGAATVGNSNAFRFTRLNMNPSVAQIVRPDKTGSLSQTVAAAGRRSGSGSMACSLAGSGTAGTAPDIGAFLQALFGKAPAVSGGTSVTYAMDDNQYGLSVFDFWTPSTALQQIAFGTIVRRGRFSAGQDVASVEFDLQSRWVIDSAQFASAATAAKGGLTAFPSEPGSPTTNGNMAIGFTGANTIDGSSYAELRSFEIDINANRELPNDVFNSYYPGSPGGDIREVGVSWSIYDTDASALNTLKGKAISQTPVAVVFQIGTVPGNIWTFTMNNVVLNSPATDDGQRRKVVNFSGRAYASSLTAKDECTLVLT
jgi:hypothetical protein